MMVRCGACRSSFDVPGPGKHRCPACGATNQVAGAAPAGAAPPGPGPQPTNSPLGGAPQSAAPPPIDISKIRCGECNFEFIVGEVEVAACPNCRAEVPVGGPGE